MNPLVFVVGAVVLLGLASSSRRAPAATPPAASGRTTTAYGRGKVRMLAARLADARIANAIERWAPVFTPGLPTAAVIALGASSTGPREQLNTPPGAWGLFGVEPAWLDQHGADATTIDQLGRAVTRASYPTDLAGQVYLGLRRYAAALASAAAVGARVNARSWGPWEMQAAVCAYSAGEGALRALLRRAPVAATHDPPAVRWTRIAEDTSREILADQERAAAWALVRPRERYESALALARSRGDDLAWFADAESWPTEIDVALSRLAHRRN